MNPRAAIATLSVLLGVIAASVSAEASPSASQETTLTIYSGREEKLVKPLYERFTRLTGIRLRVRYGDSAELAATIGEEGRSSPADLFFAQDAGALGAIAKDGRLKILAKKTLQKVPSRFRAPGKRWVGVSGRARVVAYNTDVVRKASLPKTIWGYTNPRWKGKIGLPPTNASFQAFVTAMRLSAGEDRTRDWLTGIKANGVRFYAKNSHVVSAIANREILVGFVNHYYLYQLKEEQPNAAVANHFLGGRDPGALVNAAGIGVLASTKRGAAAQRFVDFLLSREAQIFFTTGPGRAEYPLVRGVKPRAGLPPLARVQGPKIALSQLGFGLPRTLELLNDVGYTQ